MLREPISCLALSTGSLGAPEAAPPTWSRPPMLALRASSEDRRQSLARVPSPASSTCVSESFESHSLQKPITSTMLSGTSSLFLAPNSACLILSTFSAALFLSFSFLVDSLSMGIRISSPREHTSLRSSSRKPSRPDLPPSTMVESTCSEWRRSYILKIHDDLPAVVAPKGLQPNICDAERKALVMMFRSLRTRWKPSRKAVLTRVWRSMGVWRFSHTQSVASR
mmetsp:Transcript_16121/g.40633  ORF Transcript_16121/g.40633 Transcript_16121/m.40633 type:complete len:224 (-) Transcript_16121:833-1504(-)